jgi:hypothetical protein
MRQHQQHPHSRIEDLLGPREASYPSTVSSAFHRDMAERFASCQMLHRQLRVAPVNIGQPRRRKRGRAHCEALYLREDIVLAASPSAMNAAPA